MSAIPRPCPSPSAAACAAAIDVELAPAVAALLSPAQRSFIAGHLCSACAALKASGEVRVRIIADDEMSQAHLQFSRIEGSTDVLTFDLSDGASAATRVLDCDLFVCLDEAARQAGPRGHQVERELLLYALHGVLHCLGEDDHTDAGYARMHAAEDALLEQLGVGSTFARPVFSSPAAPALTEGGGS